MSLLHLYRFVLLTSLIMGGLLSTQAIANTASSEVQLKRTNIAAYLGIGVDVLSKELAAQVPEDILVGQGIMVTGFAANSTAGKQGGIKVYDILLSYDQQPLMHPKRFIKLIRNDKPGRTVKLTIARQGKIITVPVTLSSQQYPLDEDQLNYQYNMQTKGYDGMKIQMFSEDDFKASIRYLAPDGVVRSRTFSGTYYKVQNEIRTAPDLSTIAKQELMKTITKRKDDEEGWFGKWIPFNDGNFSPDSIKNFGL